MVPKKTPTARMWGLIIPQEWEEAEAIIAKCRELSQRYYIILHDEDVNSDGTAKRPHYHVLCGFANPRQMPTVLGYFAQWPRIQQNSLEKISNPEGAKRYLVHFDQPEKTPYELSKVETNDLQYKDVFLQKLASVDEIETILNQYDDAMSARNCREFCESFKPILQHMSPYQKFQAIRGLRKDYREMREEGKC